MASATASCAITAATFTYTSTAFPMLTGTLVTIAGFVPVGFAASSAGEYTFTLFAVVAIALIASWFSSQALSQTINAVLSGTTVTQLRDDIYLIDIVARAIPEERAKLETLRSLMINAPGGRSVPLEQVAKLS